MKKFARTAKGLALALGLSTGGACATDGNTSPTGTTAHASTPLFVTEAQGELEALRALDVLVVGDLLVALPSEASCAYTGPCSGWEDAAAEEIARQLPRLQTLRQVAADAVYEADLSAPAPS